MPDRVSLTAGAWITFSLTPPFPSSVWLPFIHPGASTDPHCASVSWHPLVFSFPCLWALHLELVYSWLYILIRLPLLIPSLRHTFFYTEVDRRWAHSCNLPATVPGEMPHEGFAVDWIAPKDVISRQPSWIIFPGLPCLAGCIHLPIKYNLRLPCGLPLHSNHLPHPPHPPLPLISFFSVYLHHPSQKLFFHDLSDDHYIVRQTSRWAIWLAVSPCLFPCCQTVRWDKTLFSCICHGFMRNEKSLG